jgi:hypothetical protein
LAKEFFPSVTDIVNAARGVMNMAPVEAPPSTIPADIPDNSFGGPF